MFNENAKRQYEFNAAYAQSIVDGVHGISEFAGSGEVADYFKAALDGHRAIIFATAHWGSYLKTFNLIGNSFPEGSRFVALRGQEWNIDEERLWNEINRRSRNSIYVHRVLDRSGLISVLRDIKNGTHAFILFDLFEKYGRTSPVKVFDWNLQLASRWLDMAYKANAVVCFIKPMSIHRNHMKIHGVVDPYGFMHARDFVETCNSFCAGCLQDLLIENPEFWFMWEDLEKLLALPGRFENVLENG
ncbi:hypothetical protein [Rhizobium fabae]|uniref:Uncharacterized protein n=2 Tax=Rhizobium TaxID=379 RepID=A0A7W6BCD6_9HYPH|nr:hypothetical protein [Rhizobium fabae]MBB3919782.1 hypothetical protein [Rhizobium fabae]RUM05676.1 hypothetical protein EFB14_32710 [Rhizobium fabae]